MPWLILCLQLLILPHVKGESDYFWQVRICSQCNSSTWSRWPTCTWTSGTPALGLCQARTMWATMTTTPAGVETTQNSLATTPATLLLLWYSLPSTSWRHIKHPTVERLVMLPLLQFVIITSQVRFVVWTGDDTVHCDDAYANRTTVELNIIPPWLWRPRCWTLSASWAGSWTGQGCQCFQCRCSRLSQADVFFLHTNKCCYCFLGPIWTLKFKSKSIFKNIIWSGLWKTPIGS